MSQIQALDQHLAEPHGLRHASEERVADRLVLCTGQQARLHDARVPTAPRKPCATCHNEPRYAARDSGPSPALALPIVPPVNHLRELLGEDIHPIDPVTGGANRSRWRRSQPWRVVRITAPTALAT